MDAETTLRLTLTVTPGGMSRFLPLLGQGFTVKRPAGASVEEFLCRGCGIAPEKIPEIFEPFFTTKAPGKGTGLGLYNVKTIVNKMHGVIAVDSQIDKGTTFTLTFPNAEPDGQGPLS